MLLANLEVSERNFTMHVLSTSTTAMVRVVLVQEISLAEFEPSFETTIYLRFSTTNKEFYAAESRVFIS